MLIVSNKANPISINYIIDKYYNQITILLFHFLKSYPHNHLIS